MNRLPWLGYRAKKTMTCGTVSTCFAFLPSPGVCSQAREMCSDLSWDVHLKKRLPGSNQSNYIFYWLQEQFSIECWKETISTFEKNIGSELSSVSTNINFTSTHTFLILDLEANRKSLKISKRKLAFEKAPIWVTRRKLGQWRAEQWRLASLVDFFFPRLGLVDKPEKCFLACPEMFT